MLAAGQRSGRILTKGAKMASIRQVKGDLGDQIDDCALLEGVMVGAEVDKDRAVVHDDKNGRNETLEAMTQGSDIERSQPVS